MDYDLSNEDSFLEFIHAIRVATRPYKLTQVWFPKAMRPVLDNIALRNGLRPGKRLLISNRIILESVWHIPDGLVLVVARHRSALVTLLFKCPSAELFYGHVPELPMETTAYIAQKKAMLAEQPRKPWAKKGEA